MQLLIPAWDTRLCRQSPHVKSIILRDAPCEVSKTYSLHLPH